MMLKFVLILTIVIVALAKDSFLSNDEEFEKFKGDYQKVYETKEEEAYRKSLFIKTLDLIKEHNAKYDKGLVTYYLGINQFADRTPEEVVGRSKGKQVLPRQQ